MERLSPAVIIGLMVLLLAPAVALACPVEIRMLGPLTMHRTDLRSPKLRATTRAAWGLTDAQQTTVPLLSQRLHVRGLGTFHGRSYRSQRALSIDAYGPEDDGWLYFSDDDPSTPECALEGMLKWQPPRIRVRQTSTTIRVLAVATPTPGDRTGCVRGPDRGVAACPNLTRTIVRLVRPVGNRQIYFETVAGTRGEDRI